MFKRILCVLFCLLLCLQVSAAPSKGIEKEITAFMAEHSLDESNFSMSYYNLKSGEAYSFNEKHFVPVGKLWTLPLHMYFYEEELLGNLEPEISDPEIEEEFRIAGLTLEECRYQSIILGEESISEKMMGHIGTLMQYQQLINDRYGKLATDTLPVEYWNGQVYSAEFLMNCIRTISSQPERFGELMANFRMAQKADAFADGAVPYMVVQIRGEQEGQITAIAEVSAYEPYLLVASVTEEAGGDEILSALNKTISGYVERSVGLEETTAPTETAPRPDTPNYYIGEERLQNDGTLSRWLFIAFGIAGGLALVAGIFFLIWRSKNRQY